MTSRERYYLNHHLYRLMLWQIAQIEEELRIKRAEKRERTRNIIRAYKYWKFGINRVIADNLAVYNRAILKGN